MKANIGQQTEFNKLEGFVIMLKPDADKEEWLYIQSADIYAYGIVTLSCREITDGENILPCVFKTKEEADNMKNLMQGTITKLDYDILVYLANKPNMVFANMLKDFSKKAAGDSVSKLLRNNALISHGKGCLYVSELGKRGIKNYQEGKPYLTGTPYRVLSVKEILEREQKQQRIIPQGTKLF